MAVGKGESLQSNGKLDVATTHDILDLEFREFRGKSQLLNDARILFIQNE